MRLKDWGSLKGTMENDRHAKKQKTGESSVETPEIPVLLNPDSKSATSTIDRSPVFSTRSKLDFLIQIPNETIQKQAELLLGEANFLESEMVKLQSEIKSQRESTHGDREEMKDIKRMLEAVLAKERQPHTGFDEARDESAIDKPSHSATGEVLMEKMEMGHVGNMVESSGGYFESATDQSLTGALRMNARHNPQTMSASSTAALNLNTGSTTGMDLSSMLFQYPLPLPSSGRGTRRGIEVRMAEWDGISRE